VGKKKKRHITKPSADNAGFFRTLAFTNPASPDPHYGCRRNVMQYIKIRTLRKYFKYQLYLILFCCLISCNQSEEKRIDALVLDSIRAYDRNLIGYGSNYKKIFALLKSARNDTTEIEILEISSLMEIKYYKLSYLYLGYGKLIFSNYPFIDPVSEKRFDEIIKNRFSREYRFWKYQKDIAPIYFDKSFPVLIFYNGNLIGKRYTY
jgi:hypothetical protein